MKQELQKILNIHAENVAQYQSKKEKLASKIAFCQAHNFKEEERIARVEFDAIDMIVYRYAYLVTDIQDILNLPNP